MDISARPQPDASIPDASVEPPASTSLPKTPIVTTQGAPDGAGQDDAGLSRKETRQLANAIVDDVHEPLETAAGQEEFGDALDGKSASTRTDDEQENTDNAVEHLADEKSIGDLNIRVVRPNSEILDGDEDSKLTGPADDATLYVSKGLTPEELGEEVHAAVMEIAEEVVDIYGVDVNKTTLFQFFSGIVSTAVSQFIYHSVVNEFYALRKEEAAEEATIERITLENLIRQKPGGRRVKT